MLTEYNLRHHYETLHTEKYKKLQGQQRRNKMNELLVDLKKQEYLITHSREIGDAAVKASNLIADEIAQAAKQFSGGEFVKTCMLKAAEILCSEKHQAYANISLARNAVADRISDLTADLDSQLKHKLKSLLHFQLQLMKVWMLQILHNWIYSSAELMTLSPSPRSLWSWC